MNNGPPKNKEASELWALLSQAERPHAEVPFPRRGVDKCIWVVVLTEAELMTARAAAAQYAHDLLSGKNSEYVEIATKSHRAYDEIYSNELVVELVVRCSREPGKITELVFPNSVLARKFLTSDEFATIFMAYKDFQLECGPLVSGMTPPEMEAWIDKLGEGAKTAPLALLSSELRGALLLHSASLIRSLRTASGSAGSPPSGSSSGGNPSENDSGGQTTPSPPLVAEDERPPATTVDE